MSEPRLFLDFQDHRALSRAIAWANERGLTSLGPALAAFRTSGATSHAITLYNEIQELPPAQRAELAKVMNKDGGRP